MFFKLCVLKLIGIEGIQYPRQHCYLNRRLGSNSAHQFSMSNPNTYNQIKPSAYFLSFSAYDLFQALLDSTSFSICVRSNKVSLFKVSHQHYPQSTIIETWGKGMLSPWILLCVHGSVILIQIPPHRVGNTQGP